MSGTVARRLSFVALCVTLGIAFAALGVWQIERRTWKLDLIARIDARIHAAPGGLPVRREWTGDHAYARVRVRGVFLHDRETLVQAVTDLGPGWWVLTPLRTADATVLVNRGFVSPERRDPATRTAGALAGPVTINGLLRTTEPGGGFLRRNDPAAGRWYSRDVAAIARVRGLGETPPVFIDADATANLGGYPVGGLTVVAFPNNHLAYALTWFALAILSWGGAALLLRSGGRR